MHASRLKAHVGDAPQEEVATRPGIKRKKRSGASEGSTDTLNVALSTLNQDTATKRRRK